MIIEEDAYLAHYGTPRHSGRYPWGSHNNVRNPQLKRSMSFLDTVDSLRQKGMSDSDIATGMGIGKIDYRTGEFKASLTQLRSLRSIALADVKQAQIGQAEKLKAKGMSPSAIAKQMGLAGESSVRALLAPGVKERAHNITNIADMLKTAVDEQGMIDIGSGVETHVNTAQQIGVSETKLKAAVEVLKQKGYTTHQVPQPQIGTRKDTKRIVLAKPGITQKHVFLNKDKIGQIVDFSKDDGRAFGKPLPPIPVDPKRVKVVWKEDGGGKADGVLYVREGVPDLSLGNNRYAQVRVQVGPGHYLKGMAVYKDKMPPGVDIVFNSVKSKYDKDTGKPLDKTAAMKELETKNADYPFGAIVRQIGTDMGTKDAKLTSAMNLVHDETGWLGWKQTISSQVLTKQGPTLAKEQLAKSYDRRVKELDEISELTNPVIRKKLLEKAADSFDSAAVHLKVATLSQRDLWHVILPVESLSPNQVYAPNYRDGERVALVRYPHGGTFEIPDLVVNNKNPEARKLLGDARAAIGIHHEVAERLSGADFDGDTVLVIPNNHRKIKSSRALDGLKGFDPVALYPKYDGMTVMTKSQKQNEMGKISNLITDMTLKGASRDHLTRAIKHSMVVIDAEKKELNWKQSAIDNNIAKLKEEYQGGPRAGADTLISRKKQSVQVPERRLRRATEGGPIDSKGRQVFVPTGKTRRAKDGTIVEKKEWVRKLALVDDVHELSSGTPHEVLYANYSNNLKSLANKARLMASKTPSMVYSPSAAKTYAKEVESLKSKLTLVKMNRPRERQAQQIASAIVRARKLDNPNLDKDKLRTIEFQELENARIRMNAKGERVIIEPNEWNAIQHGALHHSTLSEILDKADLDVVKKLATPRRQTLLSATDIQRAKVLLARPGVTRAMVAQQLGVSLSTLDRSTVASA